jgi:hypothetical protein
MFYLIAVSGHRCIDLARFQKKTPLPSVRPLLRVYSLLQKRIYRAVA